MIYRQTHRQNKRKKAKETERTKKPPLPFSVLLIITTNYFAFPFIRKSLIIFILRTNIQPNKLLQKTFTIVCFIYLIRNQRPSKLLLVMCFISSLPSVKFPPCVIRSWTASAYSTTASWRKPAYKSTLKTRKIQIQLIRQK